MGALAQASETPERLWNRGMAATTAEEVAHLAASARLAQARPQSANPSCRAGTVWKVKP